MNNEQTEIVITEKELAINMMVAAWEALNKRFTDLLDKVSDEEMAAETAPGRNTGTYLLGHITAANDGMLLLMGLGDRTYPEMEETFLKSADKTGNEMPTVSELRARYQDVSGKLHGHFKKMTADEWFGRHTAVSAEDFVKEPNRNKLNILISRTAHQSYHMGQMAYLAKK